MRVYRGGMLFPTIEFGIFFLVVFTASWAMRAVPELRKLFLLGASYFFYGWWDWRRTRSFRSRQYTRSRTCRRSVH